MKSSHFDYQIDNSLQQKHFQSDLYANYNFHLHRHRDYEALLVIAGSINIISPDRTETASAGEMALILPNQIHGYRTPQDSSILVMTFSAEYVKSFHKQIAQKEAECMVCDCPAEVREYVLCQLLPAWKSGGEAYYRNRNIYVMEPPPPLSITALLYVLCAHFLQTVRIRPASATQDHQIISRLLEYISDNFRDNITIASAAQALGYTPAYTSRCLQNSVGINFRHLVNQLRIDYACNLLHDSALSITEISIQSGFQNIRSFNRSFLELIGCTPSEYRECKSVKHSDNSEGQETVKEN